ncbi:MAG: class I SAM-dependent methyltransferase [archaeon]
MQQLDELFSEYGREAYIHAKRLYVPKFMADQNEQVTKAVMDVLPQGGRVIYPGCGTGIVLQKIIEQDPTVAAIGFDIAQGMIDKAIETTDPRIKYLLGDAQEPNPGLYGTAEVVILKNSLYFLDPEIAIPRMADLLRPQGHLVFTTFQHLDPQTMKDRLWGTALYDVKERPKDEFAAGDITQAQLDEVLASVDLEVFYQTQILSFIRPSLQFPVLKGLLMSSSFSNVELLDPNHYADTMYLIRAQKQ